MDQIDKNVILFILKNFFDELNINIIDKIIEFDYDKNTAGHWGSFGYADRDLKTDNFWKRDQNLVRRFEAVLSLNHITPFGLRVTFYKDRPFSTELYTMGQDVPAKIEDIAIVSVYEE